VKGVVQLLWLAWRSVLRQRRRSALGVGAVALGVAAMLLAAGFIEWMFWAMREDRVHSTIGHIQITREGYRDSAGTDPFRFLLPARAPELLVIEQTPGVRAVAPRLGFSGLVSLGETTLSFIGEGADPARERAFDRGVVITAGEALAADDPHGIVVGDGLARNLGLKVGDKVVLLVNTRSGGINAAEVHVRGFFSTVTQAFDDSALRVPLSVAQQLLRVEGTHVWVLVLDDTSRTQAVLRRLAAALHGKGLELVPWTELADFYNKTVDLFSRQVLVMKLIIAVIIVLSISNTMTMSVLERTGEIGTAMALGVRRAGILRQFVTEGLVIGVLGGALGVLVGIVLALAISAIGIPMPPPPGMGRGFVGEIRITGGLIVDAVVLAVATTLVASLYPAWKASRMQVVDALRHNR
jgi:putative ABC transport system permease protein